ncbi:hypothetical protein BUALT_Bualt19G0075800 [Buddleja alternifolia]|uniref:Leucine-rich repeat-containing N-terminal plant-type domain-containing protein n=1 Tax=Buddleja alternifolia TaxID=168488 RepID=A0AAV6W678_9LAMI|nr:hypothetical protein BUALT_Bualt19G0075800 [Buddleja alternifolia]
MAKLSVTSPLMILWSVFFFFHLATTPATCSNNKTDLQALLAFKNAINGGLSSWNATLHYCNWKGILCSRRHQSRVVSINLRSQGLVGSISPHIGNLSFLRTIILQNNSFHGQIPEEIGRLRRLQKIEFSNNSFSGEIPRNLSQCRNLYYLNMIDNDLTGIIIPEIGSLIKLKALGLSINNLSDNYFNGVLPASLSNASLLEELYMHSNNFTGQILKDFSRLSSLRFVDLSSNHLEGDISFISSMINCTSLEALLLSKNLLSGSLPDSISNLSTQLSFLAIDYSQLHGTIPSGIGNLIGLNRLSIANNYLEGPIPSLIALATVLTC